MAERRQVANCGNAPSSNAVKAFCRWNRYPRIRSQKDSEHMPKSHTLTRRTTIGLFLAAAVIAPAKSLRAQTGPAIKIYKEPTCGCCTGWARHLTSAGFSVSIVQIADIEPIKAKLGVPDALATCHTAEIGDYVIEGHVPAPVIRRFLSEKLQAKGLAVPGMPAGSPGMEGRSLETYDVILFGPNGQRTYARCRGAQEI